jgi:hypothetical protein
LLEDPSAVDALHPRFGRAGSCARAHTINIGRRAIAAPAVLSQRPTEASFIHLTPLLRRQRGKDRLRFMMRWFVAVVLLPAVSAATLPTPSQSVPPKQEMSCCLKMDAPSDGGHCKKQGTPLKSPARLCCPACTMALALFCAASARLDFAPVAGQPLSLPSLERLGRAERPPVPPPRAALS